MTASEPSAIAPWPAAVFDMDGVVTDTAGLHAAAWQALFDRVLAERAPATASFDPDSDYRRFVDGRNREDGVRSFLAARDISVAEGEPDDGPDTFSIHGLAERKNRLFVELAARDGIRAFPSTVQLLNRLRASGVRLALVTASRNAPVVLAAAGVADMFDAVVDGTDAANLELAGKPDPAMFVEAARRLGVAPAQTVVVEDAAAGVEAGRRGGFGLVVGVDRGGQRARLIASGANVVVGDLGQLDLGARRGDPSRLTFVGFDAAHEAHREALCTLANGYFATRGAAPETRDDGVHYPGTYLAGVYNRVTTRLGDTTVETEHLVNTPNWLPFDLAVDDGGWWSAGGLAARWDQRDLDLRRGVLTRTCQLATADGRQLAVTQRRLVSMAQPHLASLETTTEALGWSGRLRVRAGLDGGVVNGNVADDRTLTNRHLVVVDAGTEPDGTLVLETATNQSGIRLAIAARLTVDGLTTAPGAVEHDGDMIGATFDVAMKAGEPVVIDKTVAVATGRDPAVASARLGALDALNRTTPTFAALLPDHEAAWRWLWDRFAVTVDADSGTQAAIDLHLFHLAQTLSPHTVGLDAGVTARGLHGEGYRGHVFWDELFVFPLLTLRTPALTRSLLLYRWRRLDAARASARAAGLAGALFPWQSGSDGREETPDAFYNPRSGRWMPDNSHLQRHVGLAVAYNVWQYYQATGDIEFLAEHGAELLVEITRLFAVLAVHDPLDDRYDIAGVMGPDEYHDAYPDSERPGLRNNAYTNALAAWVTARTLDAVALLDGHHCGPLWERLALDAVELDRWARISRRMRIPFHDGVISQFDGYEHRAELDWEAYRHRYGNIGRLDLLLEAEGDSPNRYRLAKQADVLMLFYLFPSAEITALFDRLGYPLDDGAIRRTVDYYLARTAHGSTLSRVVHAWVLARLDRERSWSTFRDALDADVDDTQGGTTGEGIHLGAMAATVDLILRGYAGLAVHDDTLWLDPCLPAELARVQFHVDYRRQRLAIDVRADWLHVELAPCAAAAVRVAVAGETRLLAGGDVWDHPLQTPATSR